MPIKLKKFTKTVDKSRIRGIIDVQFTRSRKLGDRKTSSVRSVPRERVSFGWKILGLRARGETAYGRYAKRGLA